ncbi:MAG: hypothetical protein V1856_00980 [Candidatus Liptonbacteria bacterium]
MATLIKNIQLVRGDGSVPERRDILICGQKTSAIGSLSNKIAADVYDGKSAYLSSGWIDFHSEADHQAILDKNRNHSEILKQGVTTILGGHDGVSIVPASIPALKYFKNWGGPSRAANWKNFSEFWNFWDKSRPGVNFGSLVGYSSLRAVICGGHYASCPNSKLTALQSLLKDSLSAGAAGLSVDLHLSCNPSQFLKEIERLSRVLAIKNKILVLDISSDSFSDRKELLEWLKGIDCRVVIDNFGSVGGKEEILIEGIAEMENVYLEYPIGSQDLPIFRFLPRWFLQNADYSWSSLRDPWLKNRVLKNTPVISWKDVRIARAHNNPALVGLTISEYARHCGIKDAREALLHLATSTHGQIALSRAPRKSFPHWLALPRVVFTGQSARMDPESRDHPGLWHGDRVPADFLAAMINSKVMTLPEAIIKMTGLPAGLLNLKDRGIVREGADANFTLFEIQHGKKHRDKMNIKSVFVNGRMAWDKDSETLIGNSGRSIKSA